MSSNLKVSKAWGKNIFEGRVVLCTGGSGDICSHQVQALVELDADACIIGRSQEKADKAAQEIKSSRAGSRVLALVMSTAGAAGNFLAPFQQLSANAFRTVVEIDLLGSFNTAKAIMTYLLESAKKHNGSGGRIIFVSTPLHYAGTILVTHAAAAKAGVDALSAQIAIELGPRGITSNLVAPAPIEGTEGFRRLGNDHMARENPLGRAGSVGDVANATVYLFSDAGSYITGTTLVVDGGAWRTAGADDEVDLPYPDAVLEGQSKLRRSSKM